MKKITALIPAAIVLAAALIAGETHPVGIFVSKSGKMLRAEYDNGNDEVVIVLPDKSEVRLHRDVSASGSRYTGDGAEFWEHHGEATYRVDGEVLFVGERRK